ncbi:Putative major intrinsic protein [Septoria linicola]|uniref:Major intrinsic protein n=1 Tax=Septoria linicola TaxID=215465 RepID=A0A9Q9B1Q3_9PEZI|nr:putative major intrinsic protein [Septoria linicola]USW59045.1 Putative major intrinsic protein [Septoria linicola]
MSSRQPRPSQGRTATGRSTRTAGTAISQDVDYSLAGPPSQGYQPIDPHGTHYDEGYFAANPWMESSKPKNENFSLAGTFPHKVRWGSKKPKQGSYQHNVSSQEKGESEAAPQVPTAIDQGLADSAYKRDPKDGKRDPRDPRPDAFDPESSTLERIKEQPSDEDDNGQDIERSPTRQSLQPSIQQRTVSHYGSKGQRRGTLANEAIVDGLDPKDRPFNHWAIARLHLQRPLAEWLGTTVLMFIGISGNLSVITSDYQTGTMQSMYWCWGFAVMLAIYIAGGGSGAFLNPALTLMLSVFRGFPARRVPVYIIVQLLGAFTGAILAFAIYKDNIIHMDDGLVPESTGMAFYTQPKDWVSNSTAFFTEMLGTAVIGCSIMALGDSHNSPPGAGMHAFIIGLLTTAVTMSLGFSTGGCFNPVRDLGPRLATIAVGYPSSTFAAKQNWWIWGPWCATITGALLGGLVYDLCIFKGGESPVNYSFGRWQIETLKNQAGLTHALGLEDKTRDIERKLESGEIHDEPKL